MPGSSHMLQGSPSAAGISGTYTPQSATGQGLGCLYHTHGLTSSARHISRNRGRACLCRLRELVFSILLPQVVELTDFSYEFRDYLDIENLQNLLNIHVITVLKPIKVFYLNNGHV